jgi:hypothetical protein
MPVEHLARAGLKRYLGRQGGKVIKNLTWDDAVKGLQHQTRETLNVSKITNNGELLPSQVKLMEDTFSKNTDEGLEFLEQFEDGIINDNWNNFGAHLSDATQKSNQDLQGAAIENSRGMKIDPEPEADDLLPLGPWPLIKKGKGGDAESFVPDIDDTVSKSLLAADDQKSLIKGLRTPLYTELAEHNIEITPEELVSSGLFDTMLKRQDMLKEQAEITKGYRAEKEAFTAAGMDPNKDRPLKRAIKNFKTNNRSLRDLASLNLFTQTKDVFKINRDALKKQIKLFGDGKKEWHHTFFTNRQGGLAFLNKIAQDPMIAANLMLKLKRLEIPTSGTIANLSLLSQIPHDKLHRAFRKQGIELGDLDIGEYMKAIGDSVAKGETSINEMFDILDVYAEVVMPYLKEQTEAAGPAFKNIEGFEETTKSYVSEPDIKLGRNVKPKKSKAKQKVVPAPPK